MDTENSPLFSVCVISYNNEKLLPDLFTSIASQTFLDWELVFVDDCSKDNTCAFIESQTLIPPDKLTLLVNEENQKQFKSREKAYAHACGKYAITIDSDDTFTENTALEKIANIIERENQTIDIVMFNMTRSSNYIEPFTNYAELFGGTQGYIDKKIVFNAFISDCKLNNLASKAIRLQLLKNAENESRPYKYYEDRFQSFLAFKKSDIFFLLDENLYYYRINPESITERNVDLLESFINLSEIESEIHFEAKRHGHDTNKELVKYINGAQYLFTQLTTKFSYPKIINSYKTISTNEFFRYAYENCDKESLSILARIAAKLAYNKNYFRAYLFAQLRRAINFVYNSLFAASK